MLNACADSSMKFNVVLLICFRYVCPHYYNKKEGELSREICLREIKTHRETASPDEQAYTMSFCVGIMEKQHFRSCQFS